jgi:Uncharacterized conserved protein
MSTNFVIKIEHFEGPLETLLTMVEKRKLFINDISLATVADGYIQFVQQIQQEGKYPINEVAGFIVVASTLLLIKSKSLLPDLELTQEEERSVEDLELRLNILSRIKEASKNINRQFGKKINFFPCVRKNNLNVFVPDKNTNLSYLLTAMKVVIGNLPQKEFAPKAVIQKVISLEQMMDRLTQRMTNCISMSFSKFSGGAEKVNVIVSFLAMLELVKGGILQVKQDNVFDDIEMSSTQIGIPIV